MRKVFTKIICFTVAAIAAIGICLVSACSGVYSGQALKYTSTQDEAESNGGFAVAKGDYVYFINGVQDNTADNTFGNVVKGAIMRISKSELAARNYSSVETVVPVIAYSGNTDGGIFIYGDYVYYATPSTDRNSDGEILNSNLDFKRTKLDGTETMRNRFVQLSDNTTQYRYVKDGEDVYLLYVATSENLYGTSYTNLHSVNTRTGVDTLLAYNVGSVIFDSADPTNPNVYYTMNVTDFALGTTSSYNQIYRVNASATQPKDYSEYFNEVFADDEDGYDPAKDPKYVNCGTLVFDGIGKIEGMMGNASVFNYLPDAENVDRSAYTYTLSKYQDGVLFYTRTSSLINTVSLFEVKDTEVKAESWNPVTSNDSAKFIKRDGSSASSYTYILDGDKNVTDVIIADANGLIKTKIGGDTNEIITDIDNKDTFYMTKSSQPTVLFTKTHGTANYIYYSLTGGNGYTIHRIGYDGTYADYNNPFSEEISDCTPVQILDLDSNSSWYLPEMFDGQLLFPTQTTNMTDYSYVMVCDLRVRENGSATDNVMDNRAIDELNKQYSAVTEAIDEIDETVYENIHNALRYAFYTNEKLDKDGNGYIDTLIQAYVDIMNYDKERFWSEETVAKYKDFVNAEGDWSEYAGDTIEVNKSAVTANKLEYYYSLLGVMTEADAEAYSENLKTTYLQAYPESETTWFEGLSTGAKVGFIIGVCAGGIIVIGAVTVVTLVIIRKRKAKLPVYTKKRIKVDTTDDKNIDVYSDADSGSENS